MASSYSLSLLLLKCSPNKSCPEKRYLRSTPNRHPWINNLSILSLDHRKRPMSFSWNYFISIVSLYGLIILSRVSAKPPVIPVLGRQVVLLDTTQEAQLGWIKHPPSDVTSQTQGWLEESYTHFEHGINWRSYVACDVAYDNVNNWLWTPFVPRQDANRLFIEIRFSMRDCSLFPGKVRSCKETFSLLSHEVTDAAEGSRPPDDADAYTLIDRIAADKGRFTSNNDMVINTEVRDIPLSKNSKGVYFAFQDQGACISILAVKVYYITCPNVTINSAIFPETSTGPDVSSLVETFGQCMTGSVQIEPPKYLCKSDGSWYYMTGSCMCMVGTERNRNSCRACPAGKYKAEISDGPCLNCPDFSTSNSPGAAECRCQKGFFRAPSDPKAMSCSQPPSAPLNVTIDNFDQSSVLLRWNPPSSLGGRTDVVYRVGCDICGSSVSYSPSQAGITGTRVKVTGLSPNTRYHLTVYAENGVSEMSQDIKYERVSVATTDDVPGETQLELLVQAEYLGHNKVRLTWRSSSLFGMEESIDLYEIQYSASGAKNSSYVRTKTTAMIFDPLLPNSEYYFRVRPLVGKKWGKFSDPVTAFTNADPVAESQAPVAQIGMIAGITVALLLCVILFGIMFYMFWKRNNDSCGKKQASDCDTLEYRHTELPFDHHHHPHLLHPMGMGTPIYRSSVPRTYVDPHTYEDPTQAFKDFTRELDPSLISIDAVIGGGEFGDVCRGTLLLPNKCSMSVAIKTLNQSASSEKAKADFLMEATIMGQFDHNNVIYLQGVVTRNNPVMIITEYMENGSLDAFLRSNIGGFQSVQLTTMLRGIACGMNYLASKNYVHRDLAARNVLVNKNLICKIADFGLSREIESRSDSAYTTKGGKIPVRWTAPEAISLRKYTTASDVWSFGIVCWEVISYGERPYWNWSNQDVIKSIEKGYRLPPPMKCPDSIYQLMQECWQHELLQRPTFGQCLRALDKLIRCPSQLSLLVQASHWDDSFGASSPESCPVMTVEGWLTSLGLGCYAHNFSNISNLDAFARLSPDDLVHMGVTAPAHHKALLSGILALREHLSANVSEGFLV